jgi:hypothetical protein
MTPGEQLEQYTLQCPQEVLMVTAQIGAEPDQVMIFRGFSSSLMRPTAPDPDVPVLPAEAVIEAIDRLQAPYRPEQPQYIAQGLSWPEFQTLLTNLGLDSADAAVNGQ